MTNCARACSRLQTATKEILKMHRQLVVEHKYCWGLNMWKDVHEMQ